MSASSSRDVAVDGAALCKQEEVGLRGDGDLAACPVDKALFRKLAPLTRETVWALAAEARHEVAAQPAVLTRCLQAVVSVAARRGAGDGAIVQAPLGKRGGALHQTVGGEALLARDVDKLVVRQGERGPRGRSSERSLHRISSSSTTTFRAASTGVHRRNIEYGLLHDAPLVKAVPSGSLVRVAEGYATQRIIRWDSCFEP